MEMFLLLLLLVNSWAILLITTPFLGLVLDSVNALNSVKINHLGKIPIFDVGANQGQRNNVGKFETTANSENHWDH